MKKILLFISFFTLSLYSYGQCDYVLTMQDSWGDGWNNSYIDVDVAGTVTTYTFDGAAGTPAGGEWIVNITVNPGDAISVTYYASGTPYPTEQYWQLQDAAGTILFSDGAIDCFECNADNGIVPPTDLAGYSGTAACPSCLNPTGIAATNITGTSADISWTDPNGTPGTYMLEYGPTGFTQGTGTSMAAANPQTISSLTGETTYDVYIQIDCGGSQSTWTGPTSFTTGCGAGTTEVIMNMFDSFGDGWNGAEYSIIDLNTSMTIATGTLAGGGTGTATHCLPDGCYQVSLTEGTYPGEITWDLTDAMATSIVSGGDPSITPTSASFTIGTGTCPSCLAASGLAAAPAGDNALLSWTDPNVTPGTYSIEWGPTGFTQGAGTTIDPATNPYPLSGLMETTTYDFYVTIDCGGSTETSAVSTFTTGFANDICLGAIPLVVGANGTCPGNVVNVDLTNAIDEAIQYPSCDGFGNFDLWYTIVAPASGSIDFISGANAPGIVIYDLDPTCTTYTEPIAGGCINNIAGVSTIPGLTPGTTYLIQVWSDAAAPTDFCIEETATTPPGCSANETATVDPACGNYDVPISWDATLGATGYNIYLGSAPGTYDIAAPFDAGNGLGVTLGSPTVNTTYYYLVVPYNGIGEAVGCTEYSFTTVATQCLCIPAPTDVDGNGITNITMGTINNTTVAEAGNYGDYTAMVTDAQQTTTLNIDITLETGYTYNLWAWVDWNNDGDFADPGEEFYLGESLADNPTTFSGSITIPLSASLGNHVIRIGGADSGLGSTPPSDPCYSGAWAAFEDYTLNVTAAPPCVPPTMAMVSNETDTSAYFTWMPGGTETTWNVEYGPAGFTQGTGTMANGVPSPELTPSDLMPQTDYEYYVCGVCDGAISDLIVTGLLDGPLPGGKPKMVELYAYQDIADLSVYGMGVANNGGGTDGQEYYFPQVSLTQGDFYYVSFDTSGINFTNFMGFAPDDVNGDFSLFFNGDDALELYKYGTVVDIFGDINVDGTGEAWEHLDGWAYRVSGTGPDGSTFDINNWTFSGINVMDGETSNATAATPFPTGTYTPPAPPTPVISTCVGPIPFTTLCAPFVGDSIQNPIMIPALPYSDAGNTAECYTDQIGNGSADVFYQFTTAMCTDSVTVSLCGSSYDTYIRILDASGTEIDFNDDFCSVQSELVLTGLMGSSVYYVVVEGFSTNNGDYTLNITETSYMLSATAAPTDISCNGAMDGAIDITMDNGLAPYMYMWSTTETTEDISGLAPGDYTVTITDLNGCTAIVGPVTIAEPMVLSITSDMITHISCNGAADGSIMMTTSGGTAPYTYMWSSTETTEDLSGLSAGDYTVTVTDANGCTTEAGPMTITEPMVLTYTIDMITDVSCGATSDGSIMGTTSGGTAPYFYVWSNFSTTEDISNLSTGDYTVIISDSNGCTTIGGPYTINQQASFSITATEITATDVSCNAAADGSIMVNMTSGTAPYTYSWSDSTTDDNIANLGGGTYTVTVTDATGCTASAETMIAEPTAIVASIDAVVDLNCNGFNNGSIDISVTGGSMPYTYLWSNNDTSEDLSGIAGGDYTVMITDAMNCTIELGPISVQEPMALMVNATLSDISCNGLDDGSVDITMSGGITPYTYMWSNNETSEDLSGLSAGSYTGTVTDANGCTLVVGPFTVAEPSTLIVTVDQVTGDDGSSNGTISLSTTGGAAPYSYTWSNNDTTEDVTGLASGDHMVTVTDAGGCMLVVGPIYVPNLVNVDDLEELTLFNVFPNPANSEVNIALEFSTAKDINVQIINALGQVVIQNNYNGVSRSNYTYNTENLPSGLYFVRVLSENENTQAIERLIINK